LKDTLGRPVSYMLMAGLVIVLLIPCFWQPHIEAGALASHLYNAWLAGQVQQGTLPGLTLAHPVTNVLADWCLQALSDAFGPDWAVRVVAALAVQIFFWGAFSWITVVHDRYPWIVVPFLAMLASGAANCPPALFTSPSIRPAASIAARAIPRAVSSSR